MGKRHYYTEEQKLFIKQNYPTYKGQEITDLFNKNFETNLSKYAIKSKATKMGLSKSVAGGFYSIKELSILCGIHCNSVLSRIKTGSLKARKVSGRWLVGEISAERLIRACNDLPEWESIKALEAAERLGYYVGIKKDNAIRLLASKKKYQAIN